VTRLAARGMARRVDGRLLGELYRRESGAVLARTIRLLAGDFALAEEVVQETFAAALVQWQAVGEPPNPRAWLLRAARNKAIDRVRRARFETPLGDLSPIAGIAYPPTDEDDGENDDALRLIFTCCHPALGLEAQVALTLRTLCGLTTDEVARAFLVEPSTMAQRLVRAQKKIKLARIPYVVPGREELPARLDAVMSVVYLVFNEGYAATAGDVLVRRELCAEAIRLGRLLERLLPEQSEPVALLALMLLHDARRETRVDEQGELVLLENQDRSRWDHAQIAEGLERVERALRLGGATQYSLQAAIAALHAREPSAEDTDWAQIAVLYAELVRRLPTPVVRLNHAVAVAMAYGAERGLEELGALEGEEALVNHHLFHAARGDLRRRSGRLSEAASDYVRALELVRSEPERRYLARRLAEVQNARNA
jgi:RNA polymerase sigma-70 factor (ECF subfamily)